MNLFNPLLIYSEIYIGKYFGNFAKSFFRASINTGFFTVTI